MCLAIPGKVIEIKGQGAVVAYGKDERSVLVGEKSVAVGNWVVVQMGVVTEIIDKKEAEERLRAWDEIK